MLHLTAIACPPKNCHPLARLFIAFRQLKLKSCSGNLFNFKNRMDKKIEGLFSILNKDWKNL